jgi:hypothetical protein
MVEFALQHLQRRADDLEWRHPDPTHHELFQRRKLVVLYLIMLERWTSVVERAPYRSDSSSPSCSPPSAPASSSQRRRPPCRRTRRTRTRTRTVGSLLEVAVNEILPRLQTSREGRRGVMTVARRPVRVVQAVQLEAGPHVTSIGSIVFFH